MEGLLDNVRQLTRELRLQMLIIDTYIPPEYQAIVDENVAWNEDIGEWQLKCVAYTGNTFSKFYNKYFLSAKFKFIICLSTWILKLKKSPRTS